MLAGCNAGTALDAFFLVNFYFFTAGDCLNCAGFHTADTGFTAGTAGALAVFPTAF